MAIVAAMRLDQIVLVLAALRLRSASESAAVRARARAKADEDAPREQAREMARDQARARREARTAELHETVIDRVDRIEPEAPESRDRDPLVEALDKRLAAVDPAIVDFDDLKLRETVLRICADLFVTPDWPRWEAGDWTVDAPPEGEDSTRPVPSPPKVLTAPVRHVLPGPTARQAEAAVTRTRQPSPVASPWRPPRPG